jgi:hypothetical protein
VWVFGTPRATLRGFAQARIDAEADSRRAPA